MVTAQRHRVLSLLGTIVLSAGALAACGGDDASDDASPPVNTASPAGQTATLKLANGKTYTVNLAPGITKPVDIFGNDGDEPVSIWGAGFAGGSEILQISSMVGESFGVELPQSASTGYVWKPAGGTAPGTVVELVEDFVLTEDKGPGSPGTHYFVYRATAAGTGTLGFSQFPPGSQEPAAALNVEVTVAP